jgi:uncharacterized protein (DUF488 family)
LNRETHKSAESPLTLWTLGHSTRSFEEFLALLESENIGAVADVRRFPGSRMHPQFNAETLAAHLREHKIEYTWFQELGGRRKPNPDSKNTAWRNPSFRAYADYMDTPEFHEGLERLLAIACERRTAIMCSEAVWWRCHRSMISDALKADGICVLHILQAGKVVEHPSTAVAKIVDGRVEYGAAQQNLF